MQYNRLESIVFAAVLTWCATCGSASARSAADMDKARMNAAVKFAETVLKYGRDTYGEKHTPLFADMLEVDTLRAPEKMYVVRIGNKVGPTPPWLPVISSNLALT